MAFATISVAEPARFVGALHLPNKLQRQLNELGVVSKVQQQAISHVFMLDPVHVEK
jgi:hypothetical protein